MLTAIKNMIKEKSAFLEAASVIFEDGRGTNLDDVIVLGEDVVEDTTDVVEDGDETDVEVTDTVTKTDPEGDDDNGPDDVPDETPIDDMSIDDEEDVPVHPETVPSDDIMDQDMDLSDSDSRSEDSAEPVDEPVSDDSLPTPVGAQTGEPIDAVNDFMNVSLDLKSNTLTDVLPVPPANADEAIIDTGDTMTPTRVDSGFGGEEAVEAPEESSFSEAITLDGGDGSNNDQKSPDSGDDSTGAGMSMDLGEDPVPDGGNDQDENAENEVTSAVRDKVEESETPTDDSNNTATKDELMKKLSSITKTLEDAKQAVMKSIG